MTRVGRITAIAEHLNDDEADVLLLVAQGLFNGHKQYGNLDVIVDSRNYGREALEEIRDALVYIGARLVQIQGKVPQ